MGSSSQVVQDCQPQDVWGVSCVVYLTSGYTSNFFF